MSFNSLYPAFMRIRYTTPYATHVMTIPTLDFANASFDDAGAFVTHNAGSVNGEVAGEGLIDALADCYNATTTFHDYSIYTMADENAEPLPVYQASYPTVGTNTLTGVDRAVQQTLSFRTSLFGKSRIVLLDRHTNNAFGKFTAVSTEEQALIDLITDGDMPFAGRDGGQPSLFVHNSITMNARLERSYNI